MRLKWCQQIATGSFPRGATKNRRHRLVVWEKHMTHKDMTPTDPDQPVKKGVPAERAPQRRKVERKMGDGRVIPRRAELTDKFIQSLRPASDGKPYEVMDSVLDRMGIRVMGTVSHLVLSFILVTRYPGGSSPTRRTMGHYAKPEVSDKEPSDDELLLLNLLTLCESRAKGNLWLRLVGRGIDPATEEERLRNAALRRQNITFGTAFDDICEQKFAGERKGWEVERDIRKNFLDDWKNRPLGDITDLDGLAIINRKKATAPGQARNLLGYIKRTFEWFVDQRIYGLTTNPFASIKPGRIIGKKKKRRRTLNNDELFALWRAVLRLPYPYRQVYQLLILTALRLNAAARAAWSEFNPAVVQALRQRKRGERIDWSKFTAEQLVWLIPAQRIKGDDEGAEAYLVPLTPDILQILESLPLFKKGDYLFSTTLGEKPEWMSHKIKKQIDAKMLRTLRAMARQRGDDPARVKLEPWVNHDFRRVVRSNLSRLKVTEEAREAVLAHARPGIKGGYDVYDCADEKREALELWAARLRSIIERAPSDNVIPIKARACG